MHRDRDDYRAMSDDAILTLAREEGIDPEMAVVLAEKLDARHWKLPARRYAFNHGSVA